LAGIEGWVGITVFSVVVTAGIIGITLTAIDMNIFTKFCFICYLAMGWAIIIAFKPLINALDSKGIIFLISGGIIYTIGALFYSLGKNHKYIHSLWHFFVLGGTVLQYLSIYFSVIK
jgi:hemolysin III